MKASGKISNEIVSFPGADAFSTLIRQEIRLACGPTNKVAPPEDSQQRPRAGCLQRLRQRKSEAVDQHSDVSELKSGLWTILNRSIRIPNWLTMLSVAFVVVIAVSTTWKRNAELQNHVVVLGCSLPINSDQPQHTTMKPTKELRSVLAAAEWPRNMRTARQLPRRSYEPLG